MRTLVFVCEKQIFCHFVKKKIFVMLTLVSPVFVVSVREKEREREREREREVGATERARESARVCVYVCV
jgi:riboflavin synthase